MTERVLTLRELNRATLARQLLLERAALPVPEAVARLIGIQAQVAAPPYIGLWTRLQEFTRDDLNREIAARRVVRATMMRSTIHLATAEDYAALWPALQPALARALRAFFGARATGLDIPRLVRAAREHLADGPRTFAELRPVLSALEPERDPDALAYAVRTHLPLVQAPAPGGGYPGAPAYALAERWLGRPIPESAPPRELLLRYLAAFGPASVQDVQAWSGLVRLKPAVEALRPELRTFRDEAGRELFDLPDAPLPPADTPAPPRFVPEYDNLVLAHADRARVIADAHRPRVFLSAARVRATFLVDGFVAGAWSVERAGGGVTLVVEPFAPLPAEARDALTAEGERLLRATERGAEAVEVRFAGEE